MKYIALLALLMFGCGLNTSDVDVDLDNVHSLDDVMKVVKNQQSQIDSLTIQQKRIIFAHNKLNAAHNQVVDLLNKAARPEAKELPNKDR